MLADPTLADDRLIRGIDLPRMVVRLAEQQRISRARIG